MGTINVLYKTRKAFATFFFFFMNNWDTNTEFLILTILLHFSHATGGKLELLQGRSFISFTLSLNNAFKSEKRI